MLPQHEWRLIAPYVSLELEAELIDISCIGKGGGGGSVRILLFLHHKMQLTLLLLKVCLTAQILIRTKS